MVEVKYIGGLGNRLFQYCLGRIIAETLGFKLKAAPIPGFSSTVRTVEGKDFSDGAVQELGGNQIDLPAVLENRTPRKVLVHGYFQRYEYYQPFKDAIRKQWLIPDLQPPAQRPGHEIVLNIRRGDYIQMGWATPFGFFEELLNSTRCDRVFIVTDVPEDPFFHRFKKYQPVLFHKTPLEDFAMLLSFKKIVISQSTFSWWAAFLSEAGEIVVPQSDNSLWSGNIKHLDVDMRINLDVTDEDRFKLVPVRESYRPNLPELMFNARHYRARLRERWNFWRDRVALRLKGRGETTPVPR
jgi:hypothetical protein